MICTSTSARLLPAVLVLAISGLSPQADAATSCPGASDDVSANAGCLTVHNGRLLIIEQTNGRLSIPGGTRKSGESARCTAERETLEETGIEVAVGTLLTVLDNGFHIFHCHPPANPEARVAWHNTEVRKAYWAVPEDIPSERWRYPNQLPALQALIQQLNDGH